MERKTAIVDESAALSMIKDGMTIVIGGFITAQHPMLLIRGIAKEKRKNLTVIGSLSASLEVDMLIGYGCVKSLVAAYVGAEAVAAMGPFYKEAGEKGTIHIWECDEIIIAAMLQATASAVPFIPVRGGLGTDLPVLNPDLKIFNDPVNGDPLLAVPARKIDIAITHASCADCFGNVQYKGNAFMDQVMARAADFTITTVEKIISPEEIRQNPYQTAYVADMIVRAPFGAHPFSSHGFYPEDDDFLTEYVTSAYLATKGEITGWTQFKRKYIDAPEDHLDYLDAVGIRKLFSLNEF